MVFDGEGVVSDEVGCCLLWGRDTFEPGAEELTRKCGRLRPPLGETRASLINNSPKIKFQTRTASGSVFLESRESQAR